MKLLFRGCGQIYRPLQLVSNHRCPMRLALLMFVVTNAFMTRAQDSSPPQPAQIEGTVRDRAGTPLAGVSVIFQESRVKSTIRTQTGVDGFFTVSTLPAGKYTVSLEKSGVTDAAEDPFIVIAGEKKRCEFIFPDPTPSCPVSTSSLATIELDERPNFTVAGVTDSTGAGGHASEARMRTGETLARDTAALTESTGKTNVRDKADRSQIASAREQVNQRLEQSAGLDKSEQASLYRQLADLDEKLKDPLSAVHEYQRAAELDPSEQNYFAWGAELLLHGADVPAIEIFRKGARLHPDSSRMLAGLGAGLYSSGSTEEASQRLCEAADLAPSQADPYLFIGKMQEANSIPLPCAEQKLARFSHDQPANALASYYYGVALWRQARVSGDADALRQAEALLQKSTELDPKLASAFLDLGNLYFARQQWPEAIANYRNAIVADPAGGEAHYRLGLAYRRSGQTDEARREFEQYTKLNQAQIAAAERARREFQQFLFVLQNKPDSPPKSEIVPPASN